MSQIRKYFKSRFPNGYIAEYDFSQLEVIALAHLSQDPMLIQDIEDGKDMHCISASFLYGADYATIKAAVDTGDSTWKEKRKRAKPCGFLIQYGGGANAMAKQTKLPKNQCQTFIDNYYRRYQGVKEFQDYVMSEVKKSRAMTGKKRTEAGLPAGSGMYVSETGRRYSFTEYDGFREGTSSFSPTQMKNYPVQGFATGDIVPMVLGKLYRVLKNDPILADNCLLINTVHDSVVFDVFNQEVLEIADEVIRQTMEDAPKYLKEVFDIDFTLDLPVDGEAGKDWLHMEPVDRIILPF